MKKQENATNHAAPGKTARRALPAALIALMLGGMAMSACTSPTGGEEPKPDPKPAPNPNPNPDSDTEQDPPPPPTPKDVTIKTYEGKNIIVRGLIPNDPAIEKIKDAVEVIFDFEGSNAMVTRFKDYSKQAGLIITVEDVPEYESTLDFRIIDEDEFAMRYDLISSETELNIVNKLLSAVSDMNTIYNIVSYGKQFDKAKQAVRIANGRMLNAKQLKKLAGQFDTAQDVARITRAEIQRRHGLQV
ncbi:MAG: hypothetical protein LBK83_16550 [Treponema sp.]|jgi:hypothetical protein|nr:hypothetical protein [Treponema sp.]